MPRTRDGKLVDLDKISRPKKHIVLTAFFEDVPNNHYVQGRLMGYIGRKEGDLTTYSNGSSGGHYVSVTVQDPTSSVSDYYLSDDLHPDEPANLGSQITIDFPAPEILFYLIQYKNKDYTITHDLQKEDVGGAQLHEEFPAFESNNIIDDVNTMELDTIIEDDKKDISSSSESEESGATSSSESEESGATKYDVSDDEKVSDLSSKNQISSLLAKEKAKRLLRQLTPDQQHIVNSAVSSVGDEGEILAKQDSDSVQRGSMQTLRQGIWLNDEVINYFLKNCLAQRDEKLCASQPGRRRSHFYSSYFIQTLFDEKNNNMKKRGKYNHKNVKRWRNNVPGKDIFELKYIVCPINIDNIHWTCAVIFMEEKRIQYYDSCGGTDWVKLNGLLHYLKDEWEANKKGKWDSSSWNLVGCSRNTPRQKNGKFVCILSCHAGDIFVCQDTNNIPFTNNIPLFFAFPSAIQ